MHDISLRSVFAASTVVLTVLALTVATGLMILTTLLRHTTGDVAAGVESIRLAEEAEVDLLLAERATDQIVQRDLATRLRRRVSDLASHVTTPEEREVYETAQGATEVYLTMLLGEGSETRRAAAHADAYERLETLVGLNVTQAREAKERAARWDRLANALSIVAAVLVFLVSATIVVWLRDRAFRPAYDLAATMRQFGQGALDARAAPKGGAELKEMSIRFNEMAEALSARRRAQIAFLGGVAHDLRGPLSVMKISIEPLTGDRPLPEPARLRAIIERIDRGTRALERMIADFLDVAHLEAGELALSLDNVDVADVAKDVVERFEGRSPRHELVLRADGDVFARCDPLRIEQVLTNLVSNAIKYSPNGGDVVVEVRRRERVVVVEVSDRGIGISREDQSRLFEPFRRVGLSRETIPGVGLGLYVVQNIVRAHGGEIVVESEIGRGTTFRVELPALQPTAVTLPPENEATEVHSH